MPKQVIHWGKQYVLLHHPETKNTSEWWEQAPYTPASLPLTGALEDYKTIQRVLNEYRGETLVVDGLIGDKTREAFKRHQAALGVNPDGIWGKNTEAAHAAWIAKTVQTTRQPNLEVVWSRPEDHGVVAQGEDPEGHVQIGIDLDRVDLEDRIRYSDGVLAHTFYTDRLTRGQINELIRVLKRARTAAFGVDE